ncbi:MAG: hypothetical protein KF797_01380 [Flavobacteriales bacterium]|nr:hypothetical protein [Flavobacteriales bacterium]
MTDARTLFTLDALPAPGTNATVTARINADHPILQGHFPGRPVVPGVCLTDLAVRVCSALLGAEHRIAKARSIKFLMPVQPASGELTIIASVQPGEAGIRAEARIDAGGSTAMKLTAELAPAN